MANCSCGNVAEENGSRCARCSALQVLELKADARIEEIHNAFDVLSKAWDPARFQDGTMKAMAGERLKAITAAYSLLKRGAVQQAPFRSQAVRAAEAAITEPKEETPERLGMALSPGYGTPITSRRFRLPIPLLVGCGVLMSAAVVGWLLFKPLDSMLMGIPVAGKVYAEYKWEIRSRIQEMKNKAGVGMGSSMPPSPAAAPNEAESNPAPDLQTVGAPKAPPSAHAQAAPQASDKRQVTRQPSVHSQVAERALPIITIGLTKNEVIGVQGAPTAETNDELDYGNSKLYFSAGVLSGWRIDPASGIRVKLWPSSMANPSLQSFGLGSTKNEVLAIQGTPTVYSQTTFGYGRSEVYFQYGRVIGWKTDPATPLRTSSR
jgi:hypothetical protein